MEKRTINKGFFMIEAITGIAVAASMLLAVIMLTVKAEAMTRDGMLRLRGELYAREAIESALDLERSNWGALGDAICASPNICHPAKGAGNTWVMKAGEETLDKGNYRRTVTVTPVYRNQLSFPNHIVPQAASGILDVKTRKVTATVTWAERGGTEHLTLETYVYQM